MPADYNEPPLRSLLACRRIPAIAVDSATANGQRKRRYEKPGRIGLPKPHNSRSGFGTKPHVPFISRRDPTADTVRRASGETRSIKTRASREW